MGAQFLVDHLLAMRLSLVAMTEGLLPFSASEIRSSIMRAVSSVDPFVGRSVRGERAHVFVTNLTEQGAFEYKCGAQDLNVTRGSKYTVRIATDSERVPNSLRTRMLRSRNFPIGGVPFELSGVHVREVDLNSLEKTPHRTFRMYFLSPTCFFKPQSPYCAVFPEAGRILHSLASTWGRIASSAGVDPRQMGRWARFSIAETGYELCTSKPLELPDGRKTAGFLGWVNYKHALHPGWSEEEHEDFLRESWMLLKFGEYVGVGLGNSIGFGLIRCEGR